VCVCVCVCVCECVRACVNILTEAKLGSKTRNSEHVCIFDLTDKLIDTRILGYFTPSLPSHKYTNVHSVI